MKASVVVRVHPRQPIPLGGETESRLAYTQQSKGQHLPERPAFALRATARRAILPLSVEVCTPVSETGRAGALPVVAATCAISKKNKHFTRGAVAVCKHFMSDILNKTIVRVLNRNWQAINIRTPQEAFCMMATSRGTRRRFCR